jgi:hypothetical protein
LLVFKRLKIKWVERSQLIIIVLFISLLSNLKYYSSTSPGVSVFSVWTCCIIIYNVEPLGLPIFMRSIVELIWLFRRIILSDERFCLNGFIESRQILRVWFICVFLPSSIFTRRVHPSISFDYRIGYTVSILLY